MAEIQEQVQQLNKNVEIVIESSKQAKQIAEDTAKKQADMVAKLEEINAEGTKQADWRKEAEEITRKNQEAVNSLITEVKTMREGGIKMLQGTGNDFASSL